MNAKKHTMIWMGETLMLFAVYSALCYFLPDVLFYQLYTRHFGFVTELEWSENYTSLLFVLSFILNAVIIYIVARRR